MTSGKSLNLSRDDSTLEIFLYKSQTLNAEFCGGEIKALSWQDVKPGEQQASAQNLNTPMVCNQGFLKAKIEGLRV